MSLFRFLSPSHAYRDLRDYVAKREQPHRLLFLIISVGITSLLIAGFVKDSFFERAYKREEEHMAALLDTRGRAHCKSESAWTTSH